MKLIHDKTLANAQINWFDKHTQSLDIKYFNVDGINDKDLKVKDVLGIYTTVLDRHLEDLRGLLNEKGLKALSNSLASVKKRRNSTKKSLQLMLEVTTISKLERLAEAKNMTISEFLEDM